MEQINLHYSLLFISFSIIYFTSQRNGEYHVLKENCLRFCWPCVLISWWPQSPLLLWWVRVKAFRAWRFMRGCRWRPWWGSPYRRRCLTQSGSATQQLLSSVGGNFNFSFNFVLSPTDYKGHLKVVYPLYQPKPNHINIPSAPKRSVTSQLLHT